MGHLRHDRTAHDFTASSRQPDQPHSFRATIAAIGPVGERLERRNRFVTTADLKSAIARFHLASAQIAPKGRGKVAFPRAERRRVIACLK